jgi:hypothetical protein
MHDDLPTLPDLSPYGPGRAPPWPGTHERSQLVHPAVQRPPGSASSLLLGVSLAANVVLLLGFLGLLVLARAGVYSPSGSSAATTAAVTATPSPRTTPTATPSPLLSAGWLHVSPSSVQVGCSSAQRHQFVVLTNTGPKPVQWHAHLSLPQNQAGLTVSPTQGQLAAGSSVPLQIQNQTNGDGLQGPASKQGVMTFESQNTAAGPAPSLRYTISRC